MRTMTLTRRLSEDSNCKTRRRKLNQEAARHSLTLQRCCWHGVPRETTPCSPFLISHMSSPAERTSVSRGTGSWRRGGLLQKPPWVIVLLRLPHGEGRWIQSQHCHGLPQEKAGSTYSLAPAWGPIAKNVQLIMSLLAGLCQSPLTSLFPPAARLMKGE